MVAHKMGQQVLVEFFFAALLRLIVYNIDDKVFDSKGIQFQRVGIKPTRDIDFPFASGLVVC